MATEVSFGTPLKDMDVGFSMDDLVEVKVIATDKDGFIRELKYAVADVPEAITTDLEALDD